MTSRKRPFLSAPELTPLLNASSMRVALPGWIALPAWVAVAMWAALTPSAAAARDCPGPELHGLFPQDIYVFRGFVTEAAALPAEDDGAFQLEVQVEEAVHLPRSRSRYAVTVMTTDENCAARPLSAQELRDRFAVGDEVKIVGHETTGPTRSPGTTSAPGSRLSLVAPYRRVALVMAEAGQSGLIKNDFDYYDALLELDARFADTEKFSLISQMGRYLVSRDDFRRLLDEQVRERRFRRQLLALYDALRAP